MWHFGWLPSTSPCVIWWHCHDPPTHRESRIIWIVPCIEKLPIYIQTCSQFNQDFTSSFCAGILSAKNYWAKLSEERSFEKNVCTKNLLVKCWWNWHLMVGVKLSEGHFWELSERWRREPDDVTRLMMAKIIFTFFWKKTFYRYSLQKLTSWFG